MGSLSLLFADSFELVTLKEKTLFLLCLQHAFLIFPLHSSVFAISYAWNNSSVLTDGKEIGEIIIIKSSNIKEQKRKRKRKKSFEFVFVSSASCLASLKLALWVCCNHWAEKKRHGVCLFVCHHGVEQDLSTWMHNTFPCCLSVFLDPQKFPPFDSSNLFFWPFLRNRIYIYPIGISAWKICLLDLK